MPLVSLRNYVSLGVRGPAAPSRGYGWPQTADGILAAEQRDCRGRRPGPAAIQRPSRAGFSGRLRRGGTMALRLALRNPDRYRRRGFARRSVSRRALAACPLDAGSPLTLLIIALPRFADLSDRPRLPGAVAVSRGRHVGHAAAVSLRRRADDADAARPGCLADGAGHRRRRRRGARDPPLPSEWN